ncbi:MAG: SUMF1/EgtB/PvdO family nonheme iron enzyme [Candidatus Omnitrophota bacterium]
MKTEAKKQKSAFFFLFFCLWLMACGLEPVFANNTAVENVSLVDKDTGAHTYDIKLDISWDNSWFIAGAPSAAANWDAAWVFAKYSVYSGGSWSNWAHCTLLNTGYTAPSGSQISFGATSSVYKGAFIYRSSAGSGSVDWNSAEIRWNYGADGVSDSATVKIKVFAIEMVYIPTGNFYVGDGTNRTGGSNSHFFDAADAADPRDPVLITSIQPYISNVSDGTGTAGDIAWVNESTYAGNLPVSRTQFNANYPTGYNAYYIMKYEISQKQYADFLNTLTSTQASTRYPNQNGNYRHTISGTYPNYSASRPDRACNYLSWMDGCAYADWASLRPFTELEFEKACRGGQTVVNNEYAWGSTSITAAVAISGSENGTETITTTNANCCYNSQTFTGGDAGQGPLRCGIFATGSSTRQTSGAGYYGVMELSGNLWERPVSVMDSQAGQTLSTFTGEHGNGSLSTNGNANTANWPGLSGGEVTGAGGGGFRGGYWFNDVSSARTSGRGNAASAGAGRGNGYGGRCARTSP